jgi:hypothetical protein
LIQLKAEIPPEIGEALLSPYPAQATILLYGRGCQDVRISTFILDNSQPDEPWLVAAGCLSVNRRGPVELLQRFQVSAQVKVFDPDRGEGNRFRPIGGLAGAGANGTVALGWPEIHGYRLMMGSDASSGATLLMPGIHAVYYERGPDSQPNPPSHDRHEYILDFLTNLLHVNKKALGLDTHPSAQLHWLGAQRYRSDLEAFVADQQRRYAALLSELVRQRAVTEEDAAGSRLKLDITIVDQRSKRVDSIPTLGIGDHPN